ncbi:MAG TPA: FHA domain-containing protein, partial [Labilithrix sp.]
MPVTVIVRSASGAESGEPPSLTFDGQRIVIGRGQGSDVRLPDPSVSTRHATIRAQGTSWAIVDEGSTNGTWVGGVKLSPQTPRVVKTGDLVRVGRVWIELAIGKSAATGELALATRDLALALVRRAMDAVGDDTAVKVRVAEGPDVDAELRLVDEGRAYLIGRAEKCDLPLADEDASREHAIVVRRGGLVTVRDLGSRNGVHLGDQRIAPDRDTPWKAPTMVRIARSVLALDEPVAAALAMIESAADERIADEPAPPPPSIHAPPPPEPPPPSVRKEEPPPSRMATIGGAPIAEIAAAPAPTSKRRVWTVTDGLVIALAVIVIAASLA